MGKRWWWGVLAMCAGMAVAGDPGAVRKQVESSMLIKGTIDVQADGRVSGYALEHSETLPKGVLGMVAQTAPHWRFEPIKLVGDSTVARAQMTLRLVAKQKDDGTFTVEMRGAHFHQPRPDRDLASLTMQPPKYPQAASRNGVGGSVFLMVKVGRDGHVLDVVAEQVNLRLIASEHAMTRWRTTLADAAVTAARDWTFRLPVGGDAATEPYWSARVPVDFLVPGQPAPKDGQWHAYVPGPQQLVPWKPDRHGTPAADAFAGGGIYTVNTGLRLLTPVDPT